MAIPYVNHVTVTATRGTELTVQLSAPSYGWLERLIVRQTTGTLQGFKFQVLERNPAEIPDTVDPYLVGPPQEIATGQSLAAMFQLRWLYYNRTRAGALPGQLLPELYLLLDAQGVAGQTAEFEITYMVSPVAMDG